MAICWPYAFTLPKFLQALRILVIPWDRILHPFLHCVIGLRKASKKKFFWEISPKCGWVGWPFSTRISPFVLPNITKTLGWVGKHIWERSPKKRIFYSFLKQENCFSFLKMINDLCFLIQNWAWFWFLLHYNFKCRSFQHAEMTELEFYVCHPWPYKRTLNINRL